ncbi:MAG: hypothetical protein LH474_11805 [Chamaesiphon sp.]|nr:hypothetical protein [Chamaesiphon sp.]
MSTDESKTRIEPIGDFSCTTEYASSSISTDNQVATAVGKYLKDSLLLANLTDRVYQLLREDLYLQRERVNNYSHPRW